MDTEILIQISLILLIIILVSHILRIACPAIIELTRYIKRLEYLINLHNRKIEKTKNGELKYYTVSSPLWLLHDIHCEISSLKGKFGPVGIVVSKYYVSKIIDAPDYCYHLD